MWEGGAGSSRASTVQGMCKQTCSVVAACGCLSSICAAEHAFGCGLVWGVRRVWIHHMPAQGGIHAQQIRNIATACGWSPYGVLPKPFAAGCHLCEALLVQHNVTGLKLRQYLEAWVLCSHVSHREPCKMPSAVGCLASCWPQGAGKVRWC
jgi:hypothetical protein